MKIFFRAVLFLVLAATQQSFGQSIKNGDWKGVIHYDKAEVPFTFNLTATKSTGEVIIKNGEDEITIKNARIKGDSLFIPMYVFDSELKASYQEGKLSGEWHKNYKSGKGPLFTAEYNQPRYHKTQKETASIAHKLGLVFTEPNGNTSQKLGLFSQAGNKVTGTIMTSVGDFRYFEGVIYGDSLSLSSFDGVHAFLIEGAYKNEQWSGTFYYQNGYSEIWKGSSEIVPELENSFNVITAEPGAHKPYYDILTAGGEYNAIETEELDGKVVIIQLMGTWCPNSLDQTKYLTEWYKTQNKEEVELMAVTYEPGNKEYAQNRIDYYSNLLDIPYPMYIGGRMSKGQAALAFPNMGKINAFPTLIMVDKQGYIRYIDSYFNGPATGQYYQEFNETFTEKVKLLISE